MASRLHVATAARRDRARSTRTRPTIRPAARTIPTTIQPQGVDDVEEPDGVATAIVVEVDSALEVVLGGAVLGASEVGVVVDGAVVVDAPVLGVVVGSATEGLLVGVDGDGLVVLGLLAGGFVDPEPPHALSINATDPTRRGAST
jgi:hypothetical protein